MEYENKYNEALKRAAIMYKSEDKSLKKSLEQIFPELRGDEDEKIRKWIINEIKVKHHNLDEDNVDFVDKAIAWLEKQGEPNPYSGTSFEYNGHTWGMCARDGGVEIACDKQLIAYVNLPQEKDEFDNFSKVANDNPISGNTGDFITSVAPNHGIQNRRYCNEVRW